MTHEPAAIPSGLRDALRRVHVSADLTRATVEDREIEATEPRELRRLLAEALYDSMHTGQRAAKSDLPLRLRDPEFERALAEAVPHRTTTARATVCAAEGDGDPSLLLVEREGVRVWVSRDDVHDDTPSPGDTVTLTVPALRPALSPGFFMVDGSRPYRPRGETLRVYVNVTDWRSTATVWARVLDKLEGHRLAYRTKALSATQLYPRRDAIVVYLDEQSRHAAAGIAEDLHGTPGVGAETSLFTERLAPGVAAAHEPSDPRPGMRGMSFGQHRASVLAHALLDHAKGEMELERAIAVRFAEAAVEPGTPARNRESAHEATEPPAEPEVITGGV